MILSRKSPRRPYRPWRRAQRGSAPTSLRALQARNRELEALHAIATIIAGTPELETMLATMMPPILQVTQVEAGAIWLLDRKSGYLHIAHMTGGTDELKRHLSEIPPGHFLEGEVALRGKGRLIRDLRTEEGGKWLISPRYRSVASVPLLAKGTVIGVLSIMASKPNTISEKTFELLQNIGVQVGVGVEKALIYSEQMEQQRLAEALAESAAIVGSSLELEEILDRLLEQAARILPADALNIMLLEGEVARPIRWRGYERFPSAHELPTLTLPIDTYPSWRQMIRERRPVIIPHIPAATWKEAPNWRWLRAYVGAPIIIQDEVVGFFNIDGTRPYQFDEGDARRLAIFARYAGTALEHARLYQQMRTYAKELEERVAQRVKEIKQRNARLNAIFNSTSEGLIVVNADGSFECINPAVERWLHRILSPPDARRLEAAIGRIAAETTEHSVEMTIGGIDFLLSARPVEGEDNAYLVTIQDITPWKAMARVQERFISTVSHELRTPITAIKLYLELLRNASEDRRQAYLDALTQEVERQAQLIEDILRLTRIDAGHRTTTLHPVDIVAQIDSIIERRQILLDKHRLKLIYHPLRPAPPILGHAEEIGLVFDNLLRNAIQYTPEGGTIRISVRKVERDGRSWISVTFGDTGIGISPEDLPHIFSRFYRSERAQRYYPQGTGLGLALVKEVVKHHGGMIEVESEVDRGTTFILFFPLPEEPQASTDARQPQSPQEAG